MKATTKPLRSLRGKNELMANTHEGLLVEARINAELSCAAKLLKVDESDLQLWFKTYITSPSIQKLSALRLMKRYQLDPLCDEVSLAQLPSGQWYPFITIDGWTKLINQEATFSGISFSESPQLSNEIPMWMECTIYRSDRAHPITVREYFSEVVTEHAAWKSMPRRMLRYRTLQQCARLAFGISGGAALETLTSPQMIGDKGGLPLAKAGPLRSQATDPSELASPKELVGPKELAPKRAEQLKAILGQMG